MVAKIKTRQMKLFVLAVLLGLASTFSAGAQEFTQGYATDDTLFRGSVISRAEEEPDKVSGATLAEIDRLYGVVVQNDETAVSLTTDTAGVFVATSGRFEVLVSNINGSIEEGNFVTISSLKGIGMKADEGQPLILGIALQDFDPNNDKNTTQRVTPQEGQPFDVSIGRILVDVRVDKNPLRGTTAVPAFLQQFSVAIAGEVVSPIRIYASLIVLLITFFLGGSMLYAGIRTSIVAIGRNPLSKKSVLKGFTRLAVTATTIFLTGFFAVYLMLRL